MITSVAAATNTSSTEIKVEEIDLDSADDDEDDAEDSQRGQVEADGSRGQLDSHHRGGSLTFQSFARIPALAPLGTSNPLEFPPITEEPNLNSNDAPGIYETGIERVFFPYVVIQICRFFSDGSGWQCWTCSRTFVIFGSTAMALSVLHASFVQPIKREATHRRSTYQ